MIENHPLVRVTLMSIALLFFTVKAFGYELCFKSKVNSGLRVKQHVSFIVLHNENMVASVSDVTQANSKCIQINNTVPSALFKVCAFSGASRVFNEAKKISPVKALCACRYKFPISFKLHNKLTITFSPSQTQSSLWQGQCLRIPPPKNLDRGINSPRKYNINSDIPVPI